MNYLPLGNTGLYVSRLCFGAMTFGAWGPKDVGTTNSDSQDVADKMVGTAIDAGINFFDTANAYASGSSERMLGRALKGKRQDAIIATKFCLPMGTGVNRTGNSRVSMMREVEDSLERLGTDNIDLYQLHMWDETTPIEETLRALDDCVRQGKVRYIGLSNSAAWQIAMADGLARGLGTERFCSLQCYYSLVGRDLEWDLLPAVKKLGLGTMIYSPLASGFLTGKYTGENASEGRRSAMAYPPVDSEQGDQVVAVLREIAEEHNGQPGQIALSWLLHQEGVTSVIVGASKQHQLVDNLAAIDIKLTDDQLKRLDQVSARSPIYPHWVPRPTRGSSMEQLVARTGDTTS